MPMYMDIHEVPGATAEAVAKAHSADMERQKKHGVEYQKYWFNESCGKIFCLCTAPNPEAAATVHREAHGLLASKIIEVAPEIAEGFLGGTEVNGAGAALLPGGAENHRDPGIRTVMFTRAEDPERRRDAEGRGQAGAWRNRPRLGLPRRRDFRGQRVIPMRPSPKSLTRRPINSAAEPHGRTAAGSLDQNDFVATRRVVDEGVRSCPRAGCGRSARPVSLDSRVCPQNSVSRTTRWRGRSGG